jgi:hypothetical protein
MIARCLKAAMIAASLVMAWATVRAWAASPAPASNGATIVQSADPLDDARNYLAADVIGKGITFVDVAD